MTFNCPQFAKVRSKFFKEVVLIIFVKSIDSNFVQLLNVLVKFSTLFIFLLGNIICSKLIQEKNKKLKSVTFSKLNFVKSIVVNL